MDFATASCRLLLLTGLILLAGCASAHAAEPALVHVAPDGDDRRDCLSPATACASFDAGYHAAAPGDVVEVAAGTYPPQTFSVDPSKTSELDVLVRPAPGAQAVVGCHGPDNCLATEGADHLTVEGIATAYLEPVWVDRLQRSLPRQGGVALDRGSQDVTFRDLDAGHLWFAAGDSAVLGGDYGPTVDEDSKIAGGDGSNQLIDGARLPRPLGQRAAHAVHLAGGRQRRHDPPFAVRYVRGVLDLLDAGDRPALQRRGDREQLLLQFRRRFDVDARQGRLARRRLHELPDPQQHVRRRERDLRLRDQGGHRDQHPLDRQHLL